MKYLIWIALLVASLGVGCSDDDNSGWANNHVLIDTALPDTASGDAEDGSDPPADTSSADAPGSDVTGADADGADTDGGSAPPWDDGDTLGGDDRPAEVKLPDDYTTAQQWPMVILLHGYTASASIQDAYFRLSSRRTDRGFIAVLPDGTVDNSGDRFWNATEACCDFYSSGVDDVAYLGGLIDEAKERLAVDPQRVYLIGHSNGGFMSYRLACDIGSKITAIASLAGSSFGDAADCAEDGSVSVLQIHADADATVLYEGGSFFGEAYPGARELAERWAGRNSCDADPQAATSIDLDTAIAGDETTVERWAGCQSDTSVELWTIEGGGHTPALASDFSDQVLDFLLDHS